MSMPITTFVAEVVTSDGVAAWRDAWAGPGYRTLQCTPPHTFGDWQAAPISVTIAHAGKPVGTVSYLENGLGYGGDALWAVGTVEGIPADVLGQLQCSPEIRANAIAQTIDSTTWTRGAMRSSTKVVGSMHATAAELAAISFVDRTAGVTATKVRAFDFDYTDPLHRARWNAQLVPDIVKRAVEAAGVNLRYRRPEHIRIHRPAVERYDPDVRGGAGRPEVVHSAPYRAILEVR